MLSRVDASMLPYFHLETYPILGLTLQVWGTFVALGILTVVLISFFIAKRQKLEAEKIWDFSFWIILSAFLGGRIVHVFFYDWTYFSDHLWDIPKFWQGGLSSIGGFLGAIVAGFVLIKKYKLDLRFIDAMIFGVPFGWAIGRIGCFLTHLHPGQKTSFFLGVNYSDGVRHDLGLYDAINGLVLGFTLLVFRKNFYSKQGMISAFVALWYGLTRFFLDFLRATDLLEADVRYLGLTPAQYGSIFIVGIGIYLLFKLKFKIKRI